MEENYTIGFLAIEAYPEMPHKVGDVIQIPSNNFIYADGGICQADYFRDFPDHFKEVRVLPKARI